VTKRLQDRVALVTGAAKGIGRAIALRFAEESAHVALVDRDAEGLALVARDVTELGGDAMVIVADATEEAEVVEGVAQVYARHGRIDVLVNNVGGGKAGRIWELSVDDWDAVMRLNLRSMFLFTRAVVPPMMERGSGRIICLSSGARNGTVWNAYHYGASAYSTAKAAIHGFIRDMAIELADHGITVNAIAPGAIDTELAGPYLRAMDEQNLEFAPSRMTPMRRLGTPREVADAALYLASDESSYVTGITLDVLGGR
jgi:NAD(P)-dependent dehydrogenase (short-subunit alcohol dehydrogenase family)